MTEETSWLPEGRFIIAMAQDGGELTQLLAVLSRRRIRHLQTVPRYGRLHESTFVRCWALTLDRVLTHPEYQWLDGYLSGRGKKSMHSLSHEDALASRFVPDKLVFIVEPSWLWFVRSGTNRYLDVTGKETRLSKDVAVFRRRDLAACWLEQNGDPERCSVDRFHHDEFSGDYTDVWYAFDTKSWEYLASDGTADHPRGALIFTSQFDAEVACAKANTPTSGTNFIPMKDGSEPSPTQRLTRG